MDRFQLDQKIHEMGLSLTDLANLLCVPYNTVRRWGKQNRVPSWVLRAIEREQEIERLRARDSSGIKESLEEVLAEAEGRPRPDAVTYAVDPPENWCDLLCRLALCRAALDHVSIMTVVAWERGKPTNSEPARSLLIAVQRELADFVRELGDVSGTETDRPADPDRSA